MSRRLIDADALTDNVDKYIYRITRASKRKLKVGESAILADIKAHIELSPTIDAVPVIRCKDCKYWNGAGKFCDYEMSGLEEDYCSWAEPKEADG